MYKSILLSLVILFASVQNSNSATTLGRNYGFGFEKGNLIRNWSFEQRADNWFDESWGQNQVVTSRFLAKNASITAVSGSFVAKFSGISPTNNSKALTSDLIPVEQNAQYSFSFYVTTSGVTPGVTVAIDFYTYNKVTISSTQLGTDYPANNSAWTLYSMGITPPTGTQFIRINLVYTGATYKGGTLFFDDLVLEKGATSSPRDRISESVTYSDDMGQAIQSQSKIAGGGSDFASKKYLVSSQDFDTFRRPNKQYSPYINPGAPDIDFSFDAKSKAYNNGNNGMTSLGNFPYSQTNFVDEAGSRISAAYQKGDAWQTHGMKADNFYADNLFIPSNPEVISASMTEPPYLYSWSKDVEGRYSLTWKDQEGKLSQQAVLNNGVWQVTRFDYFLNGNLKAVIHLLNDPTDPTNENYKQITNYNSAGQVTSTYTKERGLQKYYYNHSGQIRFVRRFESKPTKFSFTDYDLQSRPISSGEEEISNFDQESFEDFATPATNKAEHIGYIYDDLSTFRLRIGFPLTDIIPSGIAGNVLGQNGANRLVCDYRLNNEVGASAFTPQRKFVATFYNYNQYGEVTDAYKYVGIPATASQRILHVKYTYDDVHRMTTSELYDNSPTPVLLNRRNYSG